MKKKLPEGYTEKTYQTAGVWLEAGFYTRKRLLELVKEIDTYEKYAKKSMELVDDKTRRP